MANYHIEEVTLKRTVNSLTFKFNHRIIIHNLKNENNKDILKSCFSSLLWTISTSSGFHWEESRWKQKVGKCWSLINLYQTRQHSGTWKPISNLKIVYGVRLWWPGPKKLRLVCKKTVWSIKIRPVPKIIFWDWYWKKVIFWDWSGKKVIF